MPICRRDVSFSTLSTLTTMLAGVGALKITSLAVAPPLSHANTKPTRVTLIGRVTSFGTLLSRQRDFCLTGKTWFVELLCERIGSMLTPIIRQFAGGFGISFSSR